MDKLMRLLNTKVGVSTSVLKTLSTTIQNHSMHIKHLDDESLPTARSLKHVTNQMKDLYKLYQKKTTIFDSTIDTLHEEIDNFRIDAKNVFKIQTTEVVNKLRYDIANHNVPPPSTPYPSTPTHQQKTPKMHPSPYPSQARTSGT